MKRFRSIKKNYKKNYKFQSCFMKILLKKTYKHHKHIYNKPLIFNNFKISIKMFQSLKILRLDQKFDKYISQNC